MKDLKNTAEIVKAILENDQVARNQDSYLYLKVINHIAEQKGINLHGISVPLFLSHGAKHWGFPAFETVRRTRQKVQEHYPELAACGRIRGFRADKEETFRNFARGDV